MAKVSTILCCVLALLFSVEIGNAGHHHHAQTPTSPAPSVDCNQLIYSMIDCLDFVTLRNKNQKPGSKCCKELKSVLRIDAECLCAVFNVSSSTGLKVNVTKALTLPSACGVPSPPIGDCGLSSPPATTPSVNPPNPTTPSHSTPRSSPTPTGSVTPLGPASPGSDPKDQAPAPAPAPTTSSKKSDALTIPTSIVALVGSLIVAYLAYF